MASVLPPPSTSTVDLPFGESIYIRSRSSFLDDTCTVRRHRIRSNSPASFVTASSLTSERIRRQKENSPLTGSTSSLLNFKLFDNYSSASPPRRSWSWTIPGDVRSLRERLPTTPAQVEFKEQAASSDSDEPEVTVLHVINPDATSGIVLVENTSPEEVYSNESELDDIFKEALSFSRTAIPERKQDPDSEDTQDEYAENHGSPFKRWLRVLRKKNMPQSEHLKALETRWALDDFDATQSPQPPKTLHSRHRKTPSSISSMALLTAVKTASVTLASLSIYPKSQRSLHASYLRNGSSSHMIADPRASFDSMAAMGSSVDDRTWVRSVQRQRIVEEIVLTEESYIRDLKTMINVNHGSGGLLFPQDAKFLVSCIHRYSQVEVMILKQSINQSAKFWNSTKISVPN